MCLFVADCGYYSLLMCRGLCSRGCCVGFVAYRCCRLQLCVIRRRLLMFVCLLFVVVGSLLLFVVVCCLSLCVYCSSRLPFVVCLLC